MHTRTFVLSSVAAVALIAFAACSSSSTTASSDERLQLQLGQDHRSARISERPWHGRRDRQDNVRDRGQQRQQRLLLQATILQGSGGQSITLEIKNDGSVPHNFSITSMNVNINGRAGRVRKK